MTAFIAPALPVCGRVQTHHIVSPTMRQAQPAADPSSSIASLSDVMIVAANRGLGAHLAHFLRDTPNLHTTHRPQTPPGPHQQQPSVTHPLDALDREAAFTLLSSVRPTTLVSCLGGDVASGNLPDYDANKNLIDAAVDAGVAHFILISALGAGNSEGSVPFQVMDTLRPILLEKSRAEAYLRAVSSLNWTIVRPAPIVSGDGTGTAVATEGLNCYGTVTRPDLASVVGKVAASSKAIGKTLHIVDRKGLLMTAPYVRPLEFWEPLPFDEFPL